MPHNAPAVWPEGWQLPLGVVEAEDRAREVRIIEERQAQNAKIVAESERRDRRASLRIVPATCEHQEINVFRSMGSSFDDHETVFGECRSCKAWVVSTLYLSNDAPAETRPMTQKELDQFRALEDRRQRDEWSWEA